MDRSWLCIAAIALAFGVSAAPAPQRTRSPDVVGTWRLVACEDRPAQEPSHSPYGTRPKALLMYDRTGRMAIQVMKVPHPQVASGDDEKLAADEKTALFDACTAYFGTYWVDAARGVVIHRVEGDLADVLIGCAIDLVARRSQAPRSSRLA